MITEQRNQEIIEKIHEINNNELTIETLRKIQLLSKQINQYYNNEKSKKYFLFSSLKKIIKVKLLTQNPNITKRQLSSIYKIFNQEYNQIPENITIIEDDLVLYKKTNYDNPYINKTIILNQNKYKELPEIHTLYNMIKSYRMIYKEYNSTDFCRFYNFYYSYDTEFNKHNYSLDQMINHINNLLEPITNSKKVIEYSTPNNQIIYTSDIKIFINTNIENIIEAIFKKKVINFNLIAISDFDEIYCFNITQKVTSHNKYIWYTNKIEPKIWNLNEELTKQNTHKLIKIKK